MKKILLTNFNIVNYSGSEIDTLTVANYFLEKGYEIDIFTLEKGMPLIGAVNKKINIIVPNEKEKLKKEYDIIWAHHYPLLDYVLFSLKIKSNYIFYISLSSFETYEAPPIYSNELSLIGAISKEVKDKLISEGCNRDKIVVFPNFAPSSYFNTEVNFNNKIKKVCIISNHIPSELLEFKKIAEKKNIVIDIYGMGYNFKYIDNEVLKDYDVVISIGKTVYYSLAIGIPVYCYDYFGGYGFINNSNVKKAYNYNFSGRGFGTKKTGLEIFNDLKDNYSCIRDELDGLKKFAYDNFNFENNMDKLLKDIFNNKVNMKEMLVKYSNNERNFRLHVEKVNILNRKLSDLDYFENNYRYYKDKYDDVMNSTSWKITEPLRNVKNILSKLINKIRRS